jgi:hypothetical protein
MAYPKSDSFIDMRSKIKQPSKTKSILLELDKLKSDASVVVSNYSNVFVFSSHPLCLAETPNFSFC